MQLDIISGTKNRGLMNPQKRSEIIDRENQEIADVLNKFFKLVFTNDNHSPLM